MEQLDESHYRVGVIYMHANIHTTTFTYLQCRWIKQKILMKDVFYSNLKCDSKCAFLKSLNGQDETWCAQIFEDSIL